MLIICLHSWMVSITGTTTLGQSGFGSNGYEGGDSTFLKALGLEHYHQRV